jgi:hypothetical protein
VVLLALFFLNLVFVKFSEDLANLKTDLFQRWEPVGWGWAQGKGE